MYSAFIKRGVDIVLSLCGLIVLSPVFLILIVAILVDDFGSVFFAQKRVGIHKRFFKLYKFRSMSNAKDENGECLAYITFTPSFSDKVGLFIDTGNTKSDFGKGTIGEINGFNNEEEEVVSIDTIIENLNRRYPDLNLS